jgi:aldose 1-epimerase
LCASIILGANCAYAPGLDVGKGAFSKTSDGPSVDKYALANTHGMAVTILTYGGIVQTIEVPDKNGKPANVSLAWS